MTAEQMATILNGREYRAEITKEEEKIAKDSGLLVVFGASDDLTELRGVIDDEVGACDGGTILIGADNNTILPDEIDRDDEEILAKFNVLHVVNNARKNARVIRSLWCKTDEYSWTFETDMPHATFDIMEGKDKYCRGIVVSLQVAP